MTVYQWTNPRLGVSETFGFYGFEPGLHVSTGSVSTITHT